MAISLARMGSIPRDNTDYYGQAVKRDDESRAALSLAKKAAQDLRQGEIDLAKTALIQKELERTTREGEQGRGVRRDYIINREGALDLPVGVRSPEFSQDQRPSNAPFGPMGAPEQRNPMETRATIDLARINPDMADAFRTGNITERQGLEDRTRKMAEEDQKQIQTGADFAYKQKKDESDAQFEKRKQAEIERQNRVKNNIEWFNANTGRMNAGQNGKPIPVSANTQILENIQNAKKAQAALDLLSGKDVGVMKGSKDATGYLKGLMTGGDKREYVLNTFDPQGVDTRAAIADLGSMIIHDRSGAAVTVSEYPRLRPFIPRTGDSPETAKKKLARFVQVYNETIADQGQLYGPQAGYQESPLIRDYLNSQAPEGIRKPEGATVRDFASEEEANAANLPSGTEITVNGRPAVVE
jgi:hypothetical protein